MTHITHFFLRAINFTTTGFDDWKHAIVAFSDHSKSLNHRKCVDNYQSRNRGVLFCIRMIDR